MHKEPLAHTLADQYAEPEPRRSLITASLSAAAAAGVKGSSVFLPKAATSLKENILIIYANHVLLVAP